MIVYFALRGGFFPGGASQQDVNTYGVAALSALVGLFVKHAMNKLEEVFMTMFQAGSQAASGAQLAAADSKPANSSEPAAKPK